jgi:hypothetical protein
MRCWQCGNVMKIAPPESGPIRVQCSSCGKDLGLLEPRPKAPPPPAKTAAPAVPIPVSENADNPRVVDGSTYLGSMCVTFGGVVLLAIAGYTLWQSEQALSTHRRVQGQCVDAARQANGQTGRIEFFVADDGNTYQADFSALGMKVGERVPVLYDPNNPHRNRLNSFRSLYTYPSVFGGLGIIILVAGLFGIYRKRQDYQDWAAQQAQDLARFGRQFPHVCAACAKRAPSDLYRVCGPTTTEGEPGATVHTTPFVEVPICSKCLWSIYRVYAGVWLVAAGVSGGAAAMILLQDADIGTTTPLAILAVILGLPLTAAIGQFCTASWVSLGKLDPERNFVQFKNPEYQHLYEQHIGLADTKTATPGNALGSLIGLGKK